MDNMPFGDTMDKSDLDALVSLGLFAFGESKLIDQTLVDAPRESGVPVANGAMKIGRALEDAERQVKAAAWQQHQQQMPQPVPPYSYPEMPSLTSQVPVQHVQLPPPAFYQQPTQIIDNAQLELNFEPKKQDVTNDLLKEISLKLTKILNVLEKNSKKEEVVKLK